MRHTQKEKKKKYITYSLLAICLLTDFCFSETNTASPSGFAKSATAAPELTAKTIEILSRRIDPNGTKNLRWRPQSETRVEIETPTGLQLVPPLSIKYKLANGVIVELVGVADSEPNKMMQGWWRADGSKERLPIIYLRGIVPKPGPGEIGRTLGFRVECKDANDANDVNCRLAIKGARQVIYPESIRSPKKQFDFAARFVLSEECKSKDVKLEIAAGAWKDINGFNLKGGHPVYDITYEEKGKSCVDLPLIDIDKENYKVIAIDKKGKSRYAVSQWDNSTGPPADGSASESKIKNVEWKFGARQAWFFDLPLKDIERFKLQSRPYESAEFKNVAMWPNVE